MKAEWFSTIIRDWDPEIVWSAEQIDLLCAELEKIARAGDGLVFEDQPIEEAITKAHAIESVIRSLDWLARASAWSFKVPAHVGYFPDLTNRDSPLPFLDPSVLKRKLNINRASYNDLEDLPGIGPVTAQRIIAERNIRNGFNKLEEVKEVAGIGATELRKFKHAVYVGPNSDYSYITSPTIDNFRDKPSFQAYVALLKSGVVVSRYDERGNGTIQDIIIREVRSLASELTGRGYNPFRPPPGILSTELQERMQWRAEADRVRNTAIGVDGEGALIQDTQYMSFVYDLLSEAKESIRVIMFFARFEDEKRYPTDDIFEALINAHQQGRDVRVILDKDTEGQTIGSRNINKEAYEYLNTNGIPVTYDSEALYTHTKLVIVDQAHVLLGSHNWTAGSFFNYDDTSVYINSLELGQHYYREFEQRWVKYTT